MCNVHVHACLCFPDCSQTHALHICLALTFTESHLVCCNIRRTVGSLWRSCVISRRVTHLEPSHRADKPLLCLGHLEGRSCSLGRAHTYESIVSREGRTALTWLQIFHTLTYRSCSDGKCYDVALIPQRICYSTQRNMGGIQTVCVEAPLVILQWFFRVGIRVQSSAICSSAEVLCKKRDQVIKEKESSISLFKWELLFQQLIQSGDVQKGPLHILQNNCSGRNRLL